MKVNIYTLNCPISHKPVYVGRTVDPKKRYFQHCHSIRHNKEPTPVNSYFNSISMMPILEVLEEVEVDASWHALFHEGYWMEQLRCWGFKLLNITKHNHFNYPKMACTGRYSIKHTWIN